MPLLYPRATATLLDSGAMRFLDRHHLPLEALHTQDDSALNRVLESLLPPTIERALEDTGHDVARRAEALKLELARLDPTLAGAVDTTVERMREMLKSAAPQDHPRGQAQGRYAPAAVQSDARSGVSRGSPAGARAESAIRAESLRNRAWRPVGGHPPGRYGKALRADTVTGTQLAPGTGHEALGTRHEALGTR